MFYECNSSLSNLFPPCRPATRVLKKKKLKINVHRPVGTRVVFDEEGNTLPPLARVANMNGTDSARLDKGLCCHSQLSISIFFLGVIRICLGRTNRHSKSWLFVSAIYFVLI